MRVKYFSILFVAIVSVIVFMGILSASLNIGSPSHSIETKYGASQNIKGWINVSIANESINSTFKDSLNKEISALNLLKLNPTISYSCNPKNCQSDYSSSNGQTSKDLPNAVDSRVYGIFFPSEIINIESISFNITANEIPATCTNQLEVDFFDDGIVDLHNNVAGTETCSYLKTYGCFNASITPYFPTIESQPHCQRINLSAAPGYRIGAWIRKDSTGTRNITAEIYKINDDGGAEPVTKCVLPETDSAGKEVYCDVNYSVQKAKEHYVCIYHSGTGSGTIQYKTRGHGNSANLCGFWGSPPATENFAYQIFAEPKQYAGFKSIAVTDLVGVDLQLSYSTQDYIEEKYGNLKCTRGCVVPIRFKTNFVPDPIIASFDLSVDNIKVDHYRAAGGNFVDDKLYDLSEIPATLNTGFGRMYLDNSGFKAKNTTGNFTYSLYFGSKKIFEEKLSVEKAPVIKGLTPLKTAYAFPTKFEVNVDSPGNISTYEWNFGDNTTNIITANNIIHVYDKTGLYSLTITIRSTNNVSSSKVFAVNVTSPSSLINSMLTKMKTDVSKIKGQVETYDLFYRTEINKVVNTDNLSLTVKALEDRYKAANESDYYGIVSDLLELRIPEAVVKTTSAPNLIFYPKENNVNVDVLKTLDKGDYKEEDATYVESILAWNTLNMESRLSFDEISAQYSGVSEPMVKFFKFTITEKNTSLDYNSYFVVEEMENLKFKSDYKEKDADGYKYIELTGGTKEIIFSTTEDITFDDVPAYVSPPLSKLSIIESDLPTEDETPFNWTVFGLAILILLIVGVIVYIILQKWYKKRYESYLFKNKNDLYNLFHFIDMQRKKGISESDIHNKLKKAGWDSEQVKYSMKKHSGLRTGMLEIPVDKLFEKFDKKTDPHEHHRNNFP